MHDIKRKTFSYITFDFTLFSRICLPTCRLWFPDSKCVCWTQCQRWGLCLHVPWVPWWEAWERTPSNSCCLGSWRNWCQSKVLWTGQELLKVGSQTSFYMNFVFFIEGNIYLRICLIITRDKNYENLTTSKVKIYDMNVNAIYSLYMILIYV